MLPLTLEPKSNDELIQALANSGLLIHNELSEFVLWLGRVFLKL